MLIAYLLPFSYSPVFLLSALSNLDKKVFPKAGKTISETLLSELENGADPLLALERASRRMGVNTIIGQLLQSYVRITRTVGQASYATLTFFERAVKAVESSWSRFTTATKILAEAYIGVWGLILLTFILSLINPGATGYLALLPFTTLGFIVASYAVYMFLQPPIGSPHNSIRQNNIEPAIYYSLIAASILLTDLKRPVAAIILLLTGGLVSEYNMRRVTRTYRRFLNKLAETVNNVKLGFPALQEIRRLGREHPVAGGLRSLLNAIEKGSRQAGDLGFKNALQHIHQLLEHATNKYRESLLTALAFSLILAFMPTLTAHGIDVISSLQTSTWGQLGTPVNAGQAKSIIEPYTVIVPLIPLLSLRPRHPPLLLSALSLLLYHLTTTQLLN